VEARRRRGAVIYIRHGSSDGPRWWVRVRRWFWAGMKVSRSGPFKTNLPFSYDAFFRHVFLWCYLIFLIVFEDSNFVSHSHFSIQFSIF
jgi:hypothetical protein